MDQEIGIQALQAQVIKLTEERDRAIQERDEFMFNTEFQRAASEVGIRQEALDLIKPMVVERYSIKKGKPHGSSTLEWDGNPQTLRGALQDIIKSKPYLAKGSGQSSPSVTHNHLVQGGIIQLEREAALDPHQYRRAKAEAQKTGRKLEIVG